ncbi:MAG: zinc ribbon domain-containing protein [Ruminococcus sp.]|nr:zinc ribbon domain-containing protein [Ruminococcus sp.]MBQ3947804.1 zinc ribbon domain-containing protein [Ruminococcus sp.]MBR6393869.1 zinc ribbon domain-containing protein [Ruminococcus sp.]
MMICGFCGNEMMQGEFRMEQHSTDKGIYRAYPVAAFYKNNVQYCETPLDRTTGFYCPECGAMTGIFRFTKPVNFAGSFNKDLDDDIDRLPLKSCPVCGFDMDIDYPRCPKCGLVFVKK